MTRSPTFRRAASELVLRPHVFVRDVLAAVGPELSKLADAVDDLTEYIPDEPTEERLVRALIEPELPDGPLEEWISPYKPYGLEALHELIAQLRVVNYGEYCEVNELFGLDRPFYECSDGAFEQVERPKSIHPRVGLYTLDLQVNLGAEYSSAWTSQPDQVGPLTPAGLAERLAARMREFVSGPARLAQAGEIACLAALAATLWTIAEQREAQTRHAVPRLRGDVFDASLSALELGPHGETARRILVRDHPRHVPVRVDGLPEGWILPEWEGELGVFEREGDSLFRRNARA